MAASGEGSGGTDEEDGRSTSGGTYCRLLSVAYDDDGVTMPCRTRSRNVFIMNFVRVSGVTGSPCVVH